MNALSRIKIAIDKGFHEFTAHGIDCIEILAITRRDVLDMILEASNCERQENGRYRIDSDIGGDPIRVILELEERVQGIDSTLVISVHLVTRAQ